MKLEDVSASYAAYKARNRLPKRAQAFEFADGYPVVHFGELFCRMPRLKGGLCDSPFAHHAGLLNHLWTVHKIPRELRPRKSSRAPSRNDLEDYDEFYTEMMKDEKYDRSMVDDTYRYGESQRSQARDENEDLSDDEDDEESLFVKQPGEKRASSDGAAAAVVPSEEHGMETERDSTNENDHGSQDAEAGTDEQGLKLALAEVNIQEKLYAAQLRKIQLKRKLAAIRKRRAATKPMRTPDSN